MSREIYEVKRERFHLTDRNLYLLEGTWPKGYEVEAVLDGKKISVEAKPHIRQPVSMISKSNYMRTIATKF